MSYMNQQQPIDNFSYSFSAPNTAYFDGENANSYFDHYMTETSEADNEAPLKLDMKRSMSCFWSIMILLRR